MASFIVGPMTAFMQLEPVMQHDKPTVIGYYRCTRKSGGMVQMVVRQWDGTNMVTDRPEFPADHVGLLREHISKYEGPFFLLHETLPPKILETGNKLEPEKQYWREDRNGYIMVVRTSEHGGTGCDGCRYIKIEEPIFPPRKPVLPPKPEVALKPYKITKGALKDQIFWGIPIYKRTSDTQSTFDGAELFFDRPHPEVYNADWLEEVPQ